MVSEKDRIKSLEQSKHLVQESLALLIALNVPEHLKDTLKDGIDNLELLVEALEDEIIDPMPTN